MFSVLGIVSACTSAAATGLGAWNIAAYLGRKAVEKVKQRRKEAARDKKLDAVSAVLVSLYKDVTPAIPLIKETYAAAKAGDKAKLKESLAVIKAHFDQPEAAPTDAPTVA